VTADDVSADGRRTLHDEGPAFAEGARATPALSVSVVVPAHQAAGEIAACLSGIVAAGFGLDEILVIDDGSRDGTGAIALRMGVRVVRNDAALRPARARNRGVLETASDIVVFVDADVVIHPGARARILDNFMRDPALVALFGSYDDAPPNHSPISSYRNLLHHYVHQRSAGKAQTFWTGIGAVRRRDFVAAGGFDSAWESIEDVELGLRLTARGAHILLLPDLLGKHLKQWTLAGMFRTDLWGRAVPWTRLMVLGRAGVGSLNLSLAHRVSAAMVALFALLLVLSLASPMFLWFALAALFAFVWANAGFLGLLYRRGGLTLLLSGIAFHAVHYAAALLGYLKVQVLERAAAPGQVLVERK
jgi:cellulose synthase/poly-beta-1,6-N-acetylglucosamine synthase-like glycosyltransferase